MNRKALEFWQDQQVKMYSVFLPDSQADYDWTGPGLENGKLYPTPNISQGMIWPWKSYVKPYPGSSLPMTFMLPGFCLAGGGMGWPVTPL